MPFIAPSSDKKAAPKNGFTAPATDRNSGLSLTDLITGRRPVNTTTDVARGAYRGLYDGVVGLADLGRAAFGIDPFGVDRAYGVAMTESLRAKHPVLTEAIRPQYQPQTTAGKYTRALASFLPNAIGGEATLPVRAARVAVPALASEALGQQFEGTPLEGPARFLGGLGGGLATGIRFAPRNAEQAYAPATTILTKAEQKGARALVPQNGRAQAVGQIQSQAERYRNAGINPTPADVVGDAGRGLVRTLASRGTPARQNVRDFADARAVNLPGRIIAQGRGMLGNSKTLDQTIEDLTTQQGEAARANYAEPYAQTINITPEVRSALSGPEGRAAIARARRAASARRDTDMMAQLDNLEASTKAPLPGQVPSNPYYANATNTPPLPPVTGAALDRTQIALGRQGRNLMSGPTPSPDIASGLFGRQASINDALDSFEHLKDARANYAGFEARKQAAEIGSKFTTSGTADEFAPLSQATDAALADARATAMRALEISAGEGQGAAPGLARKLSLPGEQQTRNAALLGDQAPVFAERMGLEARAAANAQEINPRAGSNTFLNSADNARASGLGEAASMAKNVMTGNIGGTLLGGAKLYLKSLGLNDLEAEATANMAIDPNKTDAVAKYLSSQIGPTATQRFFDALSAGAQRAGPATAGAALASGQTQ